MIRWKHAGDLKGIVQLVRTELVPISPWHHPRGRLLYMEVARRLRNGITLVAARTYRSTPFGFLHMEFRRDVLFIDLLAVDRRHQNKHWGTILMRRAEQYGKLHKQCSLALLYVDEDNLRGLRFYERLGYQITRHINGLKVFELMKYLNA